MAIAKNLTDLSGRRVKARLSLTMALAVGVVLLTFVSARAQQQSKNDPSFRKLIDDYCAAWSTGNTDAPAKLYAQDSDLIFYDVAPFSYHGWKEYAPGVHKALLDDAAEIKLTAGDDLRVTRRGTVAWTVVPMHFREKTKDGKVIEADLRYTGMNMCRCRWLGIKIVHGAAGVGRLTN
jgi:ketosteroid isomerase-like protein